MDNFKLRKITIAVTNIDKMVSFYNNIFNCNLKKVEAYGTSLYQGKLAGINLLLCPNEIANVKAQQNRQQFDIEVNDIETCLKKVADSFGQIMEPYNNEIKSASIIDPDGNTIVIINDSL